MNRTAFFANRRIISLQKFKSSPQAIPLRYSIGNILQLDLLYSLSVGEFFVRLQDAEYKEKKKIPHRK